MVFDFDCDYYGVSDVGFVVIGFWNFVVVVDGWSNGDFYGRCVLGLFCCGDYGGSWIDYGCILKLWYGLVIVVGLLVLLY